VSSAGDIMGRGPGWYLRLAGEVGNAQRFCPFPASALRAVMPPLLTTYCRPQRQRSPLRSPHGITGRWLLIRQRLEAAG